MRKRTLVAALVAGFLGVGWASPLAAQSGGDAPQVVDDEIEVVDTDDAEPAGAGPQGLVDLLGRLHHGLVHLPIGWLMFMVLLDIAAFGFNRRPAEEVGLWALAFTVLGFVPAVVTGLFRSNFVAQTPEISVLVGQHQAMIFISFGLTLLAFGVRWLNRDRLVGPVRGAYLTLIGLAAGLVAVGGHWGGRIVFGPDFLGF